jgi:hypothetical protein
VSLGLAVTGEAFTVGDPVPYRAAYAVAEPEVGFAFGGTLISLRGYGGLGTSEVTVIETFVRDTRFGPRVFQVGFPVASDLWAWGGIAQVGQLLGTFTPRVAVESYESPQGPYVVGRLGLEVRPAVGTLYLEGALWDTPDGGEFVVIAGVRVRTGSGSTILASGGRYGPDPLLDSPAAGGLGGGVNLELARLGPVPDLSWEVRDNGGQTLVLAVKVEGARSVECVGGFTDWEAVSMLRDGDVWRATLPIVPGTHHFGFLVDGAWYVPLDAPGLTVDEWGELQATIFVGEPNAYPDVTP